MGVIWSELDSNSENLQYPNFEEKERLLDKKKIAKRQKKAEERAAKYN